MNTATARDRRRRQRAKERADRQFARQFGSTEVAAAAEDAPRAALYKGKMGSSQRRSARMQRASQAGSVSAKINPAGWFSGLNLTARSMKLGTVVLCLVLVFAFLYTPAQQYYQAQRENARLAAEYASVAERNDALNSNNDTLASDAGMEDAVRQKYGYVKQGEQVAVVSGLSDDLSSSARTANTDSVTANVLSSAVKAPEEWYTPLLDAFFGVQQ